MPAAGDPVFATFFPRCQNVHLIKDVGMMPYILHRDYGYSSFIICYDQDDYTHLDGMKGLGMLSLGRRLTRLVDRLIHPVPPTDLWGKAWDWFWDKVDVGFMVLHALPVMARHGKEIDVLQVYHLKYESLAIALLYRLFNPRGLLYLKLDTNPGVIDYFRKNPGKLNSKFHLHYLLFSLASFDLISVESNVLLDFLVKEHPLYKGIADRVFFLPNGIDNGALPAIREYAARENIVLHVSRMGIWEKGSDVALKAFAKAVDGITGWKLVLTGSMDREFKGFFDDLIESNPHLAGKVEYAGFINDRGVLFDQYQRAKIILITSRSESFCIAGVEAGALGDVIVGSDIPALRSITDGGKLGLLCPVDDVECFARALRSAMLEGGANEAKSRMTSDYVRDNFDFKKACGRLDGVIRAKLGDGTPKAAP